MIISFASSLTTNLSAGISSCQYLTASLPTLLHAYLINSLNLKSVGTFLIEFMTLSVDEYGCDAF